VLWFRVRGGGLVEFGAAEDPGSTAGDELGCQGQAEFVEQPGGGELGADSQASLGEHVADIAVCQVLQGNCEIDSCIAGDDDISHRRSMVSVGGVGVGGGKYQCRRPV